MFPKVEVKQRVINIYAKHRKQVGIFLLQQKSPIITYPGVYILFPEAETVTDSRSRISFEMHLVIVTTF